MTKLDEGSVILYKAIRKALPEETSSRRSTSDTEHSKGKGPAAEVPPCLRKQASGPCGRRAAPHKAWGWGREKFFCYLLLH